MSSTRVLVARLDSEGDVLLAGPAIRAAAHGRGGRPGRVTLLCSPRGRQAAELLPGVSELLVWHCPWIDPEPEPVQEPHLRWLVDEVAARRFDVAVVLTSFHQSALPLALLLRLAGVPEIAAISADYPGSLLDVRLRPGSDVDEDLPEPERALGVVTAAGFSLPPGDDGRLAVRRPPDVTSLVGHGRYLVLHPGASAPARAWSPQRCAQTVRVLTARGHRVVVTGSAAESELTAAVAGREALDLGGRTDLAELAGVLAGADAVIVGNTGPAHLAAAVGTPVISLFSPVVPARRWAPYRVPHVLLGDQNAPCRDSRARTCPIPGHPCLNSVSAQEVVAALEQLLGEVAA